MRWCMAVAAAVWVQQEDTDKAKTKFETEYAKAIKTIAGEHVKLAEYLEVTKMFRLAKMEYERVLELDPHHETARKKLGFKKEGELWVRDLGLKVQTQDQRKEEDAKRIAGEHATRSEKVKDRAVKVFFDLAQVTRKSGYAEGADMCLKRVVAYDYGHKAAREALGYVHEGERWVGKTEKGVRAEFREGLATRPAGEAVSENTVFEQKVMIRTTKRASEKFYIETTHFTPVQMGKAAQFGAQAFAMYHKLFGLPSPVIEDRIQMLLLKSRQEHTEFIKAFDNSGPAERALRLKVDATIWGKPPLGECMQAEPTNEKLSYDFVIHSTTHLCEGYHMGGGRPWFREGLAYYFTYMIQGTALLMCVSLAGTSEEGGKSYSDPANWPSIMRQAVISGKDPDIRKIFAAEINGLDTMMLVKSFSIVDFLVQEHRKKLPELGNALKEDPKDNGTKAFEKVFGWTPDDLDTVWQEFVRRNY